MNSLQHIWQKNSPGFLLAFVRFLLQPKSYKIRRKATFEYYKKFDQKTLHPEIKECLNYLKYHKYSAFPYKWTQKYDNLMPEVYFDDENQTYYNLFNGKKMYFPKHYSRSMVIWAVRSILKEQDINSPHIYLTSDFQLEPGSIVLDAGVAEGNFALTVVEQAKRLYLVECDSEWMQALKLTFAPWKDKVVFVEKFMSDKPGNTTTSIDTLLIAEESESYFIKMDIEGYEKLALAGMKNLIASGRPIKMNVCTYHHPNDLIDIEKVVKSYGFEWHVSEGFVLYSLPGEQPTFRKVLIRAEKNK
ncbi:MAG: FkbM family methyltransferase [Lentimicrobiaceae bacterium]|jgi:hypothetical protein